MLIVAQRPGIDDLGMCDAEERFFKAVAKGPERTQRADLSEREHIFEGGLVLATQLFSAAHLDTAQSSLMPVALLVGAVLLAGLAQYVFSQVVLLEMPFGSILKNSVFLFLGYLPRTLLGVLWQLLYWGVVALFWPLSSFLIVIAGFWLPALLSLMAIYPMLDKSFHVEETVKKMRDEQLENQNNEK